MSVYDAAAFMLRDAEARAQMWREQAEIYKVDIAALRDQLSAADAACATLRETVERLQQELSLAVIENQAFNIKAAQEINEARRQRNEAQSLLREAWPYVTEQYEHDSSTGPNAAAKLHDKIYCALPTVTKEQS